MSKNILTNVVRDYIQDLTPEQSEDLKRLQQEALARDIPIVEPEIGSFLSLLISIHGSKQILEIGTATGYSTGWLAKDNQSEIVTIELKEREAKTARKNFIDLDLADRIELLVGDAVEIMPDLDQKFDLVFIDGAKGQYIEYLQKALDVVNDGGLIVADNVLFKGMIASDELMHPRYDTLTYRLREYIEKVMNHPELDSSILPLGDGLAISLKRDKGE